MKGITTSNLMLFSLLTSFLMMTIQSSPKISQGFTLHLIPFVYTQPNLIASTLIFDLDYQISLPDTTLDTVFQILVENDTRVFSLTDTILFEKWYYIQKPETQLKVKELIINGQLTISNGGYVINDEACAYYGDIIDQMILGHRFLMREFNYLPKAGMSTKSYGHSVTQASLFAQMGISMTFVQGIGISEFERRESNNEFEFLWTSYGSLPENYMLTHVNHLKSVTELQEIYDLVTSIVSNHHQDNDHNLTKMMSFYQNEGKVFKVSQLILPVDANFILNNTMSAKSADAIDDQVVDTKNSDDNINLERKKTDSSNLFESKKDSVNDQFYLEIEKLVKQMNSNENYHLMSKFSTPDVFFKDFYNHYQSNQNINLPIQHDDFFPYSDKTSVSSETGYWTGFYSSRPSLKLLIRETSQKLNSFRKIYAKVLLTSGDKNEKEKFWRTFRITLEKLEKSLAAAQNYQGVSGACGQGVANNYTKLLSASLEENYEIIKGIFSKRLAEINKEAINFTYCPTNASFQICDKIYQNLLQDKNSMVLTVFNPSNLNGLTIRAKSAYSNVQVINESNLEIPSDKICYSDNFHSTSALDCDLYFDDTVHPLSIKSYKVTSKSELNDSKSDSWNQTDPIIKYYTKSNFTQTTIKINSLVNFTIKPDFKSFSFTQCHDTLPLTKVNSECFTEDFTLTYHYYRSVIESSQLSGIHIFHPQTSYSLSMSDPSSISIFEGKVLTEIRISRIRNNRNSTHDPSSQRYEIITRIRLFKYSTEKGIEIDTYLFPLDWNVSSENEIVTFGKDVVLKIQSVSIQNMNIFYTDSNGLEMIERAYDSRNDRSIGNTVASNFYPITSAIYIEDSHSGTRFTLMSDRAQGATSLNKGEIEVMIHRKLLTYDSRGLDESLEETEIFSDKEGVLKEQSLAVRTKHILLISNEKKGFKSHQREIQIANDDAPLAMYGVSSKSEFIAKSDIYLDFNWKLPANVKLNIRSHGIDEHVIRLDNLDSDSKIIEHFNDFGHRENLILTSFISENKSVICEDVSEWSLSINQLKSEIYKNRPKFRELDDVDLAKIQLGSTNFSRVTLRPFELRTFTLKNPSLLSGRPTSTSVSDKTDIKETLKTGANEITKNLHKNENLTNLTRTKEEEKAMFEIEKKMEARRKTIDQILEDYMQGTSDIVIILTVLVIIMFVIILTTLDLYNKMRRGSLQTSAYEEMHEDVLNVEMSRIGSSEMQIDKLDRENLHIETDHELI